MTGRREEWSATDGVAGVATIGFDGFIDTIVRVVRSFSAGRAPVPFHSKREFGQQLVDLGASNASFELVEVATKIGGNAPITANALGRLGIAVNCLGMLGRPEVNPVFRTMDANCTLHSFAEPTQTTALEFDDGKVLLAGSEKLRAADWARVRDAIGLDVLIDIYRSSDIIGFANWGELEQATDIWEGVEREVLPHAEPGKRRIVFFDLADPTNRDRDVRQVLGLIERLSAGNETVLCLNRNEAQAVALQLGGEAGGRLEEQGAFIYAAIAVDTLVVRDPHNALAWTPAGVVKASTFFMPEPRVSTGGGDNFNAGYCFARLAGLRVEVALEVAAAVAALYVASGESPTRRDVVDFLERQSGRTAEVA